MTFKFIDPDVYSNTAIEGTELTSIDLGAAFYHQTKRDYFAIGNTGSGINTYSCYASGVNSGIFNEVDFSLDSTTWTDSVSVVVDANQISQPIYFRFTPADLSITSSGTFLIHVEEF